MRSATAPEMRAGVIAANIPRNAIVANEMPLPAVAMSPSANASSPPRKSFSKGTWASEYPASIHRIGTISTQ